MSTPLDLTHVSFARYAQPRTEATVPSKLDPEYLHTLEQTAPVVQDFAEWLVAQGSLRNHQLFFVGRSMDLPYHATVAIAQQQRRDCWIRPEDVFLVDYSRGKFHGGFPRGNHYPNIRAYFKSCGLDLARPVAIVDDIYLSGTTVEDLREILRSRHGYPASVVMYDDDPMREDGARPSLAYARRLASANNDIRSAAAYIGNHRALLPSYEGSEVRDAAMALSADSAIRTDIYDPARSYEVVTEGNVMHPAYQRMDFAQWSAVRKIFLRLCAS